MHRMSKITHAQISGSTYFLNRTVGFSIIPDFHEMPELFEPRDDRPQQAAVRQRGSGRGEQLKPDSRSTVEGCVRAAGLQTRASPSRGKSESHKTELTGLPQSCNYELGMVRFLSGERGV